MGGAARNKAVQQIASEIFGLPVHLPLPGEYVSEGAAIQAAWALSGSRPEWSQLDLEVIHGEPQLEVRARYLREIASI